MPNKVFPNEVFGELTYEFGWVGSYGCTVLDVESNVRLTHPV